MPVINPRLRSENFRLPIEKIRAGYKTDTYFNRTKFILESDRHHPRVTMQLFQKVPDAVVSGVDHALSILSVGTGCYTDTYAANKFFARFLSLERELYSMWRNLRNVTYEQFWDKQNEMFYISQTLDEMWVNCFEYLEIEALYDGESVGAREPVMLIRGDLSTFTHLETLYLGALTDGTMVATNARDVTRAANGKPVLMFGARHQAAESQAGSGYAAYVGGATGVSTNEQGEYWGSKGLGTIPHALIAAYYGNTVLATQKFDEFIDGNVVRISLVDFENNSVKTSLEVARALGKRLGAVRLDTSENMIDFCFEPCGISKFDYKLHSKANPPSRLYNITLEEGLTLTVSEKNAKGVNPELVMKVRRELDAAGFNHVGIFVSGGFNAEKIARFESENVQVIGYGVGSAFFDRRGGKFEYTADVVEPVAKAGRGLWRGPELHKVDPKEIL